MLQSLDFLLNIYFHFIITNLRLSNFVFWIIITFKDKLFIIKYMHTYTYNYMLYSIMQEYPNNICQYGSQGAV